MEFESLFKNFPKSNWTKYLFENSIILNFGTSKEKKEFIDKILFEIKKNIVNQRVGKIIDWMSLGVYIQPQKFLETAKRNGILRHYSYIKNISPVLEICEHFINHKSLFSLSTKEINYLESVRSLGIISKEYKKYYQDIINIFKLYKRKFGKNLDDHSIIKSLLVINEYLFLKENNLGYLDINYSINEKKTSKEEISEAISFLINMYYEIYSVNDQKKTVFIINEEFINGDKSKLLIENSLKINALRDIETRIEYFDYICVEDDNRFIVLNEDENIAKSIDITFIVMALQRTADEFMSLQFKEEGTSIEDFVIAFNQSFPDIFEYINDNYPRFKLKIPYGLFEVLSDKFENKIYFYEDTYSMIEASNNLLIKVEDLENYIIRDNITLKDLLKARNLLNVLGRIMINRFSNKEIPKGILLRSIVSVAQKNEILQLFKTIFDENKAQQVLEILTWDCKSRSTLDLQYQPIIKISNEFLFSIIVFSSSRISRNIFPLETKKNNNIKLAQINNKEPLSTSLCETLTKNGFLVLENLPIKYKNPIQNEGDIDILAIKDDLLLIIECKFLTEPASIFELRTSYDNIIKAKNQLNYIKSAMSDEIYRNQFLSSKLQTTKLKANYKFQYAIVTSNKVFWGLNIDGFPVRSIYEVSNFFDTGVWMIKFPNEEIIHKKIWANEIINDDDIIQFFSRESYFKILYECLNPYFEKVGNNIELLKYSLNMTALSSKI
ncbi:hypothetical protein ACFPMF_06530 [Larkinella bovis]|uniref:NERD domain-containing protein n=1 Tax=Larkinella bovis TaxID=683041 RepID=A0ABW0I5Z7_9BACT